MSGAQSAGSQAVQARPKKTNLVMEQPRFDLESYIQNYRGRTRLERLIFIGICSSFYGVDALKAAVIEAKKGRDVRRYLEAQTHLAVIGPGEPEAVRDQGWVERVERENRAETQRLEGELKGYKNNLIKESIRMGNEDLGKHYHLIGDLPKAYDAFSRMRQDATIAKHIIEVQKHLIEVAIEQRHFPQVLSGVQKIKGTIAGMDGEEPALQPYMSAAEGLAYMDSGEYFTAACFFLGAEQGMAANANCETFVSPNDIAVYGGLCALATMERHELHTRVLENSNFRSYLEMEPHIRHAITFFVNSRYSACLSILENYRADYLLDIHLHKHVEALYGMVRTKSIVQYFIPFSCVTLESLNEAFAVGSAQGGGQAKSVEKELVGMIQRGELDARIDTQSRVLTSLPTATRATLQSEALQTAREYEREARRRLQHMNIRAAGLEVPSIKKGGQAASGLGMGLPDEGMFDGRALRSKFTGS